MSRRETSAQVTFQRPFLIGGFDELQAAGTYTVDMEEEQILGISFPAWKRTSTMMQVPRGGAIEHIAIDAGELKEALTRDGNPDSPPAPKPSRSRLVQRKKF